MAYSYKIVVTSSNPNNDRETRLNDETAARTIIKNMMDGMVITQNEDFEISLETIPPTVDIIRYVKKKI